MTPHRIAANAIIAILAATAPATAQTRAGERGGFVVTLGADTVHLERFERIGQTINGTVVTRAPVTIVLTWTARLNLDGSLAAYDATVAAPGSPGRRLAWTRGAMTFIGDTVVRTLTLASGTDTTNRIATPGGAVPGFTLPYVGTSYLMFELANAQALRRAARGDTLARWTWVHMIAALARPQSQQVWQITADSLEADYFGRARSGYRFDAAGRLISSDWRRTTYQYRISRVATVDTDAAARDWAARDVAGTAFGALSPRDTMRATIGTTQLTVDYSRPAKRGRRIWGGVVPLDTIWRLGADMATHITTSTDVMIGATRVPAGRYTLWMQPSRDGGAALVVNTAVNIFGTNYPPKQDLARIPLTRTPTRIPVERLTISVESGRLTVQWDDTAWSVPIASADGRP